MSSSSSIDFSKIALQGAAGQGYGTRIRVQGKDTRKVWGSNPMDDTRDTGLEPMDDTRDTGSQEGQDEYQCLKYRHDAPLVHIIITTNSSSY